MIIGNLIRHFIQYSLFSFSSGIFNQWPKNNYYPISRPSPLDFHHPVDSHFSTPPPSPRPHQPYHCPLDPTPYILYDLDPHHSLPQDLYHPQPPPSLRPHHSLDCHTTPSPSISLGTPNIPTFLTPRSIHPGKVLCTISGHYSMGRTT